MNTLEQRVRQRCQRDDTGRLVYFPEMSRHGYRLETQADFERLMTTLRRIQSFNLISLGLCLVVCMALLDHVRIVVTHPMAHVMKPVLAICLGLLVYVCVRTVMLRSFPRSDLVFVRPTRLQRDVMAARNTHIALPIMMWGFCFAMIGVTVVQWGDPIGVRLSNLVLLAILFGLAAYFTYLLGVAAGLKAAAQRD